MIIIDIKIIMEAKGCKTGSEVKLEKSLLNKYFARKAAIPETPIIKPIYLLIHSLISRISYFIYL